MISAATSPLSTFDAQRVDRMRWNLASKSTARVRARDFDVVPERALPNTTLPHAGTSPKCRSATTARGASELRC